MADGDTIRIGQDNIASNPGAGTLLRRDVNSFRSDPVFTVRTPVGGEGILGEAGYIGVLGRSGGGAGVRGISTSGIGLNGISTSGSGVFGYSTGGVGVSGQSATIGVNGESTNGFGVRGVSTNFRGVSGDSTSGVGVVGSTDSGIGVSGQSNIIGVSGRGNWGVFGRSPRVIGVVGSSDSGVGVSGSSTSGFGGDFSCPFGPSGSSGSLRLDGNVVKFNGEYSEALPHPDGSHRLLYASLSPESWYEDFGRGELVEGRGQVALDPDFAAILGIDDGHYHVFLTPEGDSNGLCVSSRNPTAFEVHEQQGGTSSLTFSYQVVAKRKDGQPERLAKVEEPERIDFARPEEEGLQQMMRQQPPQPQPPQPSMMLPSVDFVRPEEVHRGQIDELRRLVEEQRREIEELRRRMEEREEEAPPEEST